MRGRWAVGEIAGCVSELRQTHVLRLLDRHKKTNKRSSNKKLNLDPPALEMAIWTVKEGTWGRERECGW